MNLSLSGLLSSTILLFLAAISLPVFAASPPVLKNPTPDELVTPCFRISWSAVSGTSQYRLEIVDREAAKTNAQPLINNSTHYDVPADQLEQDHKYRVHVRGIGGDWSSWVNFKTISTKATLIAPANNGFLLLSAPVLSWNAVDSAYAYEWEVFDADTDRRVGTSPVNPTADRSAPVQGLALNKRYYWHVRARTCASDDPYSDRWYFSTCDLVGVTGVAGGGSVRKGGSMSFSITASGLNRKYQWFRDGALLPGATSSSLALSNLQLDQSGFYSCSVWNDCTSPINFPVGQLTVTCDVVSVTATSGGATVRQGGAFNFTVTATGANRNYQWKRGSDDIPNANAATLALSNIQPSQAGSYSCTIWNDCNPPLVFAVGELIVLTPPSNDQFENRIALSEAPVSFAGNNGNASTEAGEKPGGAGFSVWWSWQAPQASYYKLSTAGSALEPEIHIYEGSSLTTLNEIDGGIGEVIFHANAGGICQIRIDSTQGSTATGAIQATITMFPRPVNDDFANRLLLSGIAPFFLVDTANASVEPGESPLGDAGSVWWTWQAPVTAAYILTPPGPGINVYTGNALSELSEVRTEGNDSFFTARAGTTYQLRLSSYADPREERMAVQLAPAPPPNNDSFTNRAELEITPWGDGHVEELGINATAEPNEPNHGGNSPSHSLWWKWTPTSDSGVKLVVSSTDSVGVYTGSTLATLKKVAGSDSDLAAQFGGVGFNGLAFNVKAGVEYSIAIDKRVFSPSDSGFIEADFRILDTFPENDHFQKATELIGSSFYSPGNTYNSTLEPGESTVGTPEMQGSVWWKWIAPATGLLEIRSDKPARTLNIFRGSTLAGLSEVSSQLVISEVDSRLSFWAESGVTYYLRGFATDFENGASFSGSLEPEAPNNRFADRIPLTGAFASATGTNRAATSEPGEPKGRSVWWSWTAPIEGGSKNRTVEISTAGSSFDTVLDVYTGDSLTNLHLVSAVENSQDFNRSLSAGDGYSVASRIVFVPQPGTTYQIRVDGTSRDSVSPFGRIQLTIDYSLLNLSLVQIGNVEALEDGRRRFSAIVAVENFSGFPTAPLQVRLVRQIGMAQTESSGPPNLLTKNRDLLAGDTPFLKQIPGGLAAGERVELTFDGAESAAPDGAQGSGVFGILEQMLGDMALREDSELIAYGQWPRINGYPGPGGGIIRIDPAPAAGGFIPVDINSIAIRGAKSFVAGTQLAVDSIAFLSDNSTGLLENAVWKCPGISISVGRTNAILTASNITEETTVALLAEFAWNSKIHIASNLITIIPPPKIPVTIRAIPSGLILQVDAVTVADFAAFEWIPGTSHSIIAPLIQQGTNANTRFRFRQWSDNLAWEHQITAVAGLQEYTASFDTEFALLLDSSVNGILTATPAGPWIKQGTVVSLTAKPDVGYRVKEWVGVDQSGVLSATISMNGPRTARVLFEALPPLQIENLSWTKAGGISFQFRGAPELFYKVQWSGDSEIWTDFPANFIGAGPHSFSEAPAIGQTRFFRIRNDPTGQ